MNKCAAGQKRAGTKCVADPAAICKPPTEKDATGKCVAACSSSQDRVKGKCVAKCKTGQVRSSTGVCELDPTHECGEGFINDPKKGCKKVTAPLNLEAAFTSPAAGILGLSALGIIALVADKQGGFPAFPGTGELVEAANRILQSTTAIQLALKNLSDTSIIDTGLTNIQPATETADTETADTETADTETADTEAI